MVNTSLMCPLSVQDLHALALDPDLTYGHLDKCAAQAVTSLRAHGLKRGDLVVLPARADWPTICLLFAAWRLNLCVILLSPRMLALPHTLSSLPPAFVITEPTSFFDAAPDSERTLDSSVPSLLLLTSGSSGIPKWAAFTLKELFTSANAVAQALNAQPQDRWLLSLPFSHVGGLGVLLRALCTGGTLVFEQKDLPRQDRFQIGKAQFASLVPTQLFRLIKEHKQPLNTHFLVGGAPLSSTLYTQALQCGLRISLTYGLTELSSTVLLSSSPIWLNSFPYLGQPLSCTTLQLLEDGELLAGGSTLFAGYGYPPVPPASPFPTKDVGAYHERFGFSVQGRKDFQFISGGENIQPEEIEAALLTHKEVEEAIVVPLFDEEFGARPAAWIRSTLTHKELLLHLSSQLPNYKFPVVFASLKESETLKPNRSTLIEEMNKNFTFIF